MSQRDDLSAIAQAIIDTNVYMTLGTGDASGRPWVSPVYYASARYSEFYWISSPEARHSCNIAVRPLISLVIFDSRAPVGAGQAVYMSATAEELSGDEVDRGLETYPGPGRGARTVTSGELRPPAVYRLYRATAVEVWTLEPGARPDQRTPVTLGG
jgi:hypothetical protein